MNKYRVKVATLMLFFTIFAPNLISSMEKELPEEEPRKIGYDLELMGRTGTTDIPYLPVDVQKLIANKALRVILDRLQDNPTLLVKPYKEVRETTGLTGLFEKFWLGEYETKKPLIDAVMLLIQNGVDPNMKNYEGNTALHLFLAALYATASKSTLEDKGWSTSKSDFISQKWNELDSIAKILLPRIKFLVKDYSANINAQNHLGNTIAHDMANFLVKNIINDLHQNSASNLSAGWFLEENNLFMLDLLKMGLDFKTIKNNNGETACSILSSMPDYLKNTIDWSRWPGKACLPEDKHSELLEKRLGR